MRHKFVLTSLLLCTTASVAVMADVSIGINLELYPHLVNVPGYPVYYAPDMDSNYFFYDGRYWVYTEDNWYASSWYNGPWEFVDPELVPLYVLRVPVRYYRQPPMYFRGWSAYSSPRWNEHWGNDWSEHHRDWDHWDRHESPRAAPLPVYQKQYSGDRYPRAEQQRELQRSNYRYQPHQESRQGGDRSRDRDNAHDTTQPVVQPPQPNSNRTSSSPIRHRDQHDEQPNRQPDRQPDRQHANQYTEHNPVVENIVEQPRTERQRTPSPVPQPTPATRQSLPESNAPVHPRSQQPDQHRSDHQPPAPQTSDTRLDEHDRKHKEQSHKDKDRD